MPHLGQNFHEVFGKPLLPPISILTAAKTEELAGALIVDRDQLIVAVLETNDRRVWLGLLAAAGLRPIRLYDLRHTAATFAVAAGVSVKVISDQLGHASISFTLERYSHVLPGTSKTRPPRE